MRNLKKLFAVVMTVAMLASLMVPALAADSFKYEAEAKKLYDLGLFQGNSATSYEPDLGTSLNRQAGLALAIRLMGKDAEVDAMTAEEISTQLAKIVDADEITEWAKPYAAYAVKNGLTNGIDANILPNVKFGAQLDLTGKEFINFVLKAMGYQVAWDDVLTKAAAVGMLSAGDAVTFGTTAVLNRDSAVGIMASALGGTTSAGVVLAQALVDAGAVSAEAMAEAGFLDPSDAPTEAPEELTATASTNNNIQINVVYSVAVEEDSAEKTDNYKLSKGSIDKAELQDDGVTVVLTLKYDDAKKQEDKVDLTIKNVKSLEGVQIAETTLEGVEFLDKDIPSVVDAMVVGKDTVKVIFSEPMKGEPVKNSKGEVEYYILSKDGFVVNGGKLYVKEAKLQKNYTEALVKLYSSLPEGDVSFQVKSTSEDFAGFGVIGKLFSLNVVPDKEAPVVVGYESAKPTEVTLIWNEDIEFDGKTLTEWYHTNGSNNVSDVTIDGNKTTLKFNKDDKKMLPDGYAYVYVLKEAVKDLWGNKNAQQMIQIEVVIDETPPEVSEVKQGDTEDEVIVVFNEAMDDSSDSTKKASNYTILDKDGEEIEKLVDKVTFNDDDYKEVKLKLSKKIGGDYTIIIKGAKDVAGNEVAETTMSFTIEDKTNPDVDDFTATLYNGSQKDQMLKVSFGEEMATEGAYAIDDVDKYMFGTKTLKSIKNVEITVVDSGKAVEIKIPSKADDSKDGYDVAASKVTIARVADAAGNYAQVDGKDVLQFDLDIDDALAVEIEKAEATARDTIKITFADEMKFEIEDFTVTDGAYDYRYAAVETELNDKNKTVAIITLIGDDKLDAEFVTGDVYIDVDSDPETANRYGIKVATVDVDVEDKIAPELYDDGDDDNDFDVTSKGVGDYLEIGAEDSYQFTLYFSENMKTAISNDYAGADFIIKLDGKELRNGRDYKVISISAKAITFELQDSFKDEVKEGDTVVGYKVEGDLTIELVDNPAYVSDMNDNAPKAFDAIEYDDLLFKN